MDKGLHGNIPGSGTVDGRCVTGGRREEGEGGGACYFSRWSGVRPIIFLLFIHNPPALSRTSLSLSIYAVIHPLNCPPIRRYPSSRPRQRYSQCTPPQPARRFSWRWRPPPLPFFEKSVRRTCIPPRSHCRVSIKLTGWMFFDRFLSVGMR
jgi:hypothetical protein